MVYSIDSVKSPATGFSESTQTVEKTLGTSEWDDPVKDSYNKYLSQCRESDYRLKKSMNTIEETCENLNSIDLQKILSNAEQAVQASQYVDTINVESISSRADNRSKRFD